MKRITRIHKKSLNSLLIAFLIVTSIFSFSSTEAYSAEGDLPTISISSPAEGALVNKAVAAGTYENKDETVPYTDLLFSAYENEADPAISDSSTKPKDWIITNDGTNGTWTYSSTTFSEGDRKLTVKISKKTDPDQTVLDSKSISFMIDTTRPYIVSSGIVIPGDPEQFRDGEDFTRVPTNAKIKITVADNNPMTTLESIDDPFIVFSGSNAVAGTVSFNNKGIQSGKYIYDIIFTPDYLNLKSIYSVYINPKLVDNAGNAIFTRFFKFTTMSNTDLNIKDNPNNPHGNYSLTTNLCANCHSTHNGINASLEKNIYQYVDDSGTSQELPSDPSKSYCMVCHDGTMNAPIVDGIEKKYQHNNPVNYSEDGNEHNALKQTDSCTSCHDPHQSWIEENPNLLKGHDLYKSKDKDEAKTIDSLDVTCGACHDDNATIKIEDYEKPLHKDLLYKKSITSTGDLDDYSLCLRCHNTDKQINIKQYYEQTNSGHYFKMETGKETNVDGSKLNGSIPCAECHETHGSNNIKMLRENLGNTKTKKAFNKTGGAWKPSEERDFCLNCHNESKEIYGRTAKFNKKTDDGEAIIGHRPEEDKEERCSSCHGGESKTFIEAAHSPKK